MRPALVAVTVATGLGFTGDIELRGVGHVMERTGEFGWLFRIQPPPDFGIDAQIEAVDSNDRPTGKLVGLQIKSGPSYMRRTEGGWRFYASEEKVRYWLDFALPVLIVLYDPASDAAYWQVVNAETAEKTPTQYKFFVPETQSYDAGALEAFKQLADRNLPTEGASLQVAVTERRADADIGWLELIAAGNRLFVEIEEWVHKSSGRVSMRLIAQDENGVEIVEREWPWLFLPGAPLPEQLREVFPWADISVDDDHYREEEYADYVNECGIRDSEDKAYIFMRDFGDWYAEQRERGLRPYGYAGGGEVALWRLELTANELGARTLERLHQRDYVDALLAADAEAAARDARLDGYYRGSYGTMVMTEIEVIEFLYGEEGESILGAEELWTNDAGRIRAAAAILEHAMERQPTQALAEAFAARFASDFDDEGQGWVITHKEVRDWLHELGI